MSIISRMRKQIAVYWALAASESAGEDWDDMGQPQWATPVEIECRWEDDQVEFISKDGSKLVSRSVVYVDRDVNIGGVLMLGELVDVVEEENVLENDGAWEIRGYSKIPSLKATEFLRTAYL